MSGSSSTKTKRRGCLNGASVLHASVSVCERAVSAERFGIAVHAVTVMSTHLHAVLTDVLGNYPEFLALFHRLVALMTKVHRKWEGPVWDHEQTSIVQLNC